MDVAVRGGDTLRLYTDTGGGLFIYGHAADRVDWQDSAGVLLSQLSVNKDFPDPLGNADHRLTIFRSDQDIDREFGDGILGQAWFANRIWIFDYSSRKLLMHRIAPPPEPGTRAVQVGFLTDSSGARILSFPRITVVIDEDTLDMLFDTGATLYPSAGARHHLGGTASAAMATSFITSEVFNRWRARHPDWQLIPDADESLGGMSMILVPEVSIMNLAVGPVWFTERPTANFRDYMSQWMDRPVDGALGGNFFRFFRITLDYPNAAAYFIRTNGSD